MSVMVSFVLSFFARDVLDEILDLIESVSEGFPIYCRPYTVLDVKGHLVSLHIQSFCNY